MTDMLSVLDSQAPGRFHTRRLRPGQSVYDLVEWDTRDVIQTNYKTGEVLFEQRNVRVPVSWTQQSVEILASKYLHGEEAGLDEMLDRVVGAIVTHGVQGGYFSAADGEVFGDELKFILMDQRAAFNSPVWFNIGKPGRAQTPSACFIVHVEDSMESIIDWYGQEIRIFQSGSGSGANLSRIRSTKESIPGGLKASGPVSFMRGADSTAGVIRSGSVVRNAAKMVILDVDHPDIMDFIWCKAKEGRKSKALADAGFDMGLDGKDAISIQYQNANNSVRVSDAFMQAVLEDKPWELVARTTGEMVDVMPARAIWAAIAEAAWECADPGLQFADTINQWNTLADTEEIVASNPCSEFLNIDNTSCNLSSLNLMRYLNPDNTFDTNTYISDCSTMFIAQDILISFGEFPTKAIAENTRRYRQIGLGYSNLGAMLMCLGLPYDSDAGREIAASVTSLLTGAAYAASVRLASMLSPCDGYAANKASIHRVLERHVAASREHAASALNPLARQMANTAEGLWESVIRGAEQRGVRNTYVSNIAPTGTISFLMGCDTTGIEPDLALNKFKKLVGGSSMQIVNESVPRALENLGYPAEQSADIIDYIKEHNSVLGAPHLSPDHYPVFACAMGDNYIAPMGHVRMLGAVSPHLSGGISKTVNVPATTTVEEIKEVYLGAWQAGVKCLAVYRDNSKIGQPLHTSDQSKNKTTEPAVLQTTHNGRARLPRQRVARTTRFSMGDVEGYITAGEYEDGTLGELFIKASKLGSTISGFMDAFAIAVSLGVQYGVPLSSYISKFVGMKFDPAGITDDPDIRIATSMADYIFRRLAVDYLSVEERQAMGIFTTAERTYMVNTPPSLVTPSPAPTQSPTSIQIAPICGACGGHMQPSGACFCCPDCGATSGCS